MPSPSFGTIAAAIQESAGFYFLPPLAASNPSVVGTFNPNLSPAMAVCELDVLGAAGSCVGSPVAEFGPGSFSVGDGQYQLSWDTDGPETGRFNTNRFYRLQVTVGESVVGSLDLDPQNPNGPGQSTADAYAFRVGETIPVKIWMGLEILCQGESFVTECITGTVVDQTGASLALQNNGSRLALDVFPNSLPGSEPQVTLVLERINPTAYLAATGMECIPLFDAPQFGDCFRVTSFPALPPGSLVNPALVSICVDTGTFGLSPAQEGTLNMIRYHSGTYEALPSATGNCSPQQSASLVPVPENGLSRYAAMGLNRLAEFLLPEPLHALAEIRLGGFTSSFSNFRFALPGQMVPTDGVGTVLQQSGSNVIDASVAVLDYEGTPVANAMVHFETGDGSLSNSTATTGVDGVARLQWTVDVSTPGTKTLTASALGLVGGSPPDEAGTAGFLMTESVTIDVTVVGPPATVTQSPTAPLSGVAGEPAGDLTVTVFDDAGNPISGAAVTWSGDGSVVGGTSTGADGSATGTWTLGETAGANTVTASVDGGAAPITATFSATGAAGPAVAPTFSLVPTSGTAGLDLGTPVTVTVTDQYGNPRAGEVVQWSVTGGGAVSAASNSTDANGQASVTWTLGQTPGSNQLTVQVAGFTETFTVDATVGDAVLPVTKTGDGQTGTVGTVLGAPLTLLVTDQFGNPRVGDVVTWTVGGVDTDVATDGNGLSSFTWTLGTTAGAQSATATLGAFAAVAFSATATPGAAANISSSGAGGSYPIGSAVSDLSLTITDAFGNARVGDAVAWTVTAGGGSIVGNAVTAAGGTATAVWTLGVAPGANTAMATVGGLTATFNATGECFAGYGIAQVDGTFGAAEWDCASSQTFNANISGGSTPATVYWMNDGTNVYFAVRVQQSSLAKVNTLRIDFDNDGDNVAERNDDAIAYDGATNSFFDQYLTPKCENRSQSGCGADDATLDGSGAVGNDGAYTVFELAHPLSSGQSTDIAVSPGTVFGFFLTFQSGNGAQGNTQFPGFRNYLSFTVVGY